MDAHNEAVAAALKLLKTRERFPEEVRAALLKQGFPDTAVDAAVSHLERRGLLSEERAAEALLRTRVGKKAVGDERLRMDLEARGAISMSPLEVVPEIDRARAAAAPKVAKNSSPAQLARFLSGRGFQEETIRTLLEELFPDTLG